MYTSIFFQTLLFFLYIGKNHCLPIEDEEAKSEKEIEHVFDNNIDSLGLLLNSISLSSNLTTGDSELDSLFRDELIPELYSVLDSF
ncbi:YDL007C-A [Saccharomyces arboricola H-6]|uniref:YDL007C-A n=1 Tax=Saccharomyces arboricola (strain H-6 / AS 2.3317 / CBS 10644) TaxID=1160507 RepID=J8Q3T4_SACAR|nr:YDL007C-A [Saccharomyces arboricola H-6]